MDTDLRGRRGEISNLNRAKMSQKGLTLVEFVIAIGLGIIILFVVSWIGFSTQAFWTKINKTIELQREATLSMEWLRKLVRSASEAQVEPGEYSLLLQSQGEKLIYWGEEKLWLKEGEEEKIIAHWIKEVDFSSPQENIIRARLLFSRDGISLETESKILLRNRRG